MNRTNTTDAGVTLVELLAVLVMIGLVVAAGIAYALPWLGREDARGAAFQIQSNLQLARIQAVSRNRQCRFLIDTTSRRAQVVDLNDPSNATDDILLADIRLPVKVNFQRPDSGSAVTLTSVSGTLYQATFTSEGAVSAGAGEIVLFGGDRYDKVTLMGAGGTRVEHWTGGAWVFGA